MRLTTSFPCVSALLATTVAGVLLQPGPVLAQDDGRRRPVPDFTGTQRARLRQLRNGETITENDGALLTRAAQFYVNRLTEARYHRKGTTPGDSHTMHTLVAEAVQEFVFPTPDKQLEENQQLYMKAFTKPLLVEIKPVLRNPEIIAEVNAARILAYLGKAGQEDAVDLMLEILDPAKQYHDAVKFWALRGLTDLFAVVRPKPQKREQDAIQALLDFVNQKPALPPRATREEVAAVRYLRRQAIRALGQTRFPAGEGGKPPTALVLLRVARKEGFTPEPSASEQVEAAIGVCELKSKLYSDYQPAYAAHQIAGFVVDFTDAYNSDLQNTTDKRPPSEPWKYHAARLIKALEALRADTLERDKYVLEATRRATNVLRQIVEGTSSVESSNLSRWVSQNPPPEANTLYKDISTSVVKPPESGK